MAKGPEDLFYNYDKILMERAVQSMPDTLPATVLRLPMVYGPGDYQHRLFPYLKRMDDGRPAIFLEEGMASWRGERGYVEDMGEAIFLCVVSEQAAGRTYHVAQKQSMTEAEWVERIGAATGWKGKLVTLPASQLPAHLREDYDSSQDMELNTKRIREELGYTEPTSLEEAMRQSIAWERSHPPQNLDPAQFDYAAEDAALAAV